MNSRIARFWYLAVLAAVVAALWTGAGAVVGEKKKDISGTKHDVASPGTSACTACHLPRDPEGELLWATEPNKGDDFAGLKPLCFSCHDGTVTAVGEAVFNSALPEHVTVPGLKGQDCDRCHDTHVQNNGQFIRYAGGADFCHTCHEYAGKGNHPVDVDAEAVGLYPRDSTWDADTGDFSGTRLFAAAGFGPGTYVKCLSCHAPHGAAPDSKINSMPISGTHNEFMPLCQNCHYKWPDR